MNAVAPRPEISTSAIGLTAGNGSKIAPQNLGEVVRFAEVMCKADIALPQHLRGNAGACMAVALQALEWEMSPFAVASKSYSVSGRIAYEAQLIAAVVNTRSGIKGRLRYEFIGEGNDLSCKVTGILDGEECTYESPPFSAITPKNSPLWKTDPRQQLAYYGARSWARRHCPEVILGVYDRDEMEGRGPDNARDITPAQPSVMQRLQARQQEVQETREGFDADFVQRETESLSAPAADPIDEPSEASPSPDVESGTGSPAPSDGPALDHSEDEHDDGEGVREPADHRILNLKREAVDKFMEIATRNDTPQGRHGVLASAKDAWKQELPDHLDFVKACFETADKVIKSELPADKARQYLVGLVS